MLACTSSQPRALKKVHAGFSFIRSALGENSSKPPSTAMSPGLSLPPSAAVLVELFFLVSAKAESAPLDPLPVELSPTLHFWQADL